MSVTFRVATKKLTLEIVKNVIKAMVIAQRAFPCLSFITDEWSSTYADAFGVFHKNSICMYMRR